MTNGSGRAGLGAKPAVHALAHVDIKVSKLTYLGFFVHLDADRNAGDRAVSFASQAPRANIHIDFEDTAVAARQSFLDRHRNLVWILDRHRPAHQVRKCDRHPLESRADRLPDIFSVAYDVHKPPTAIFAA